MAVGVKISKPGLDVKSLGDAASDIKQYILNSLYPTLKVFDSGSMSINNGSGYSSVTHDLGYIPIAWVFYKKGNDLIPVYDNLSGNVMYVTSTQLWLRNWDIDGQTHVFYWYIFYDAN